jgi:hypothetical protein
MTPEEAVAKARQRYAEPSDDDIEIDEERVVLEGEDGYWVAAWVWVRKETT